MNKKNNFFRRLIIKNESGFALVMVMMTILTLEVICFFLAQARGIQTSISINRIDKLKARYLSEAGLAHGLWRMQEDPNWRTLMDDIPLGDGSYTVSFAEDDPNQEVLVKSQSLVKRMKSSSERNVRWLTIQPAHTSDIEEADTYLKQGDSDGVFDDKDELFLDSENSGGSLACRTLAQYNLIKYALPSDAAIVAARFSMYLYSPGQDSDDFVNKGIINDVYRIHQVTNSWWPHETTWDYRNKSWLWHWSVHGGDFDPNYYEDSCTFSNAGWKTWRITYMTRYWMEYPNNNHGFIIETDQRAGNNECKFYSSHKGEPTVRPKLTIYYLDSRSL